MLNPVFSIAHMRNMIPIFHEVVRKVPTLLSYSIVLALMLLRYS